MVKITWKQDFFLRPLSHHDSMNDLLASYVGPSSWNHLPHELRLELLSLSLPLFRKRLKTILFVRALGSGAPLNL